MTASLGLFLSKGVSRMPVIGEDVDEVIGVLYLKDVARVVHEQTLDAATLTAERATAGYYGSGYWYADTGTGTDRKSVV